MISQEEGMQDGQSDWTSDRTNKLKNLHLVKFLLLVTLIVTTSSIWISKFLWIDYSTDDVF